MKNLIFFLVFVIISVNAVATEHKSYSLQFVELFTNEVLMVNYKKQLKKRILEKNPSYKSQEEQVDIWLNTVLASGEYEKFLAARYKQIFTEAEFKDLVAFYKTDTGKKFLTTAPKMSTMSATVAGQLIYKNLPELDTYLTKSKGAKK